MLLAIGAVTLVDVVGRYFGAPLPGAFELVQLAMIVLVFTALPAVSHRREHVTIDIVQMHLPHRLRRAARALVSIACVAVAGFYAVQLFERGAYLARSSETTYNLQIALAPFAYFIAAMWAVTAVVFVVNAWLDVSGRAED
jgi:TRAP-type C4-dicarboxylate transport system permease small subunit